jgi:hypothetical protein
MFASTVLEQIGRSAGQGQLLDHTIAEAQRHFEPMANLARAYHNLPEAGTPDAIPNAPTIDPNLFRSELSAVKAGFERGFRGRISGSGDKFSSAEINLMRSIEVADANFIQSKSSARNAWERAIMGGEKRPDHSGARFVSKMMSDYNGRELSRDRVSVTVDHTMGRGM